MIETLPLVLASASPRRRELFDALGLAYELAPAHLDERGLGFRTPRELAVKAAYAKVCAAAPAHPRSVLVGVDTVVALDGRVLGKPADAEEARRSLRDLSGRTHSVISGVAVMEAQRSALLDAAETRVTFRALSETEIDAYVATGDPFDKAGGYAIQGAAGRFVCAVEGDYFNVVGLPVDLLLRMLAGLVDTAPARRNLARLPRLWPPAA